MGNAYEYQLNNGLTVVYEHIPHTQLVTVQAWIKTGSANEDSQNNGISHFLEHILFKGTENFSPNEIDEVVEAHGGIMNAGTSKDYTNYYITLPAEHALIAFKVISDMVFNASFIPDEIEKEKPVVLQEIQRKYSNPLYDMRKEMYTKLFKNTPYEMEVIGTAENVNSFDSKILREYYKSNYHPQNITLVVVGDIDQSLVNKLAQNFFSQENKSKPAQINRYEWKTFVKDNSTEIFKRDVAQEYVLIGYQVNATAKDAPAYEVLTEILSGGEYTILNKVLKYEKNIVTSVYASEILSKNCGAYIIHMLIAPEDRQKAVSELNNTLKAFYSNPVSESELEKAKNRLISRTVFRQEKTSQEANEIGYSYTLDLKDYYNTYNSKINAVTAEEIKKVAEEIFLSPAITHITTPLNKDNQIEKLDL